jgi:hypothetical protein
MRGALHLRNILFARLLIAAHHQLESILSLGFKQAGGFLARRRGFDICFLDILDIRQHPFLAYINK